MWPRASRSRRQSFDHLSPRLSAVWSADSATSLYASVGRGFEVPAIGELSAESRCPASPSLRPKSLWNYEVGARRIVGGRVLLDGSVFYADVRGEFVPRTVNNVSHSGERQSLAQHRRRAGRDRARDSPRSSSRPATRSWISGCGTTRRRSSIPPERLGRSISAASSFRRCHRHRVTGEARVSPLAAVDLGVQIEWQSVVYVETGNADAGTWYFRHAGRAGAGALSRRTGAGPRAPQRRLATGPGDAFRQRRESLRAQVRRHCRWRTRASGASTKRDHRPRSRWAQGHRLGTGVRRNLVTLAHVLALRLEPADPLSRPPGRQATSRHEYIGRPADRIDDENIGPDVHAVVAGVVTLAEREGYAGSVR